MYTEENIKRRKFTLRDILLKIMVIMVFILLLVFLLAKVMGSNNNDKKDLKNYDKVFTENLNAMKDTAIDYFTKDKLPQDIGTSKTLTLRQMINQNLIESFTDANKKACDVNNSYVRITNNDEYYTLKVNLKCPNKEDSKTIKVGQFEYCEKDICEMKNATDKQKKEEQKEEKQTETPITENNNENTNVSNNNTSSNNTNNNNINNNTNTNNNTNNNTNIPSKVYIYEYKKEIPTKVSNWSNWSEWKLNNNRLKQVICKNEDITCLKEIQLYSRREKIGTANGKAVYATVNYYSYRTRTILTEAHTDIKWSNYNDRNLLTNGYNYTGNKKEQ